MKSINRIKFLCGLLVLLTLPLSVSAQLKSVPDVPVFPYVLTIDQPTGVTIAASVDATSVSSGETVYAGNTVTLTVRLEDGYTLMDLAYNGEALAVGDGTSFTVGFTMPAAATTITGTAIGGLPDASLDLPVDALIGNDTSQYVVDTLSYLWPSIVVSTDTSSTETLKLTWDCEGTFVADSGYVNTFAWTAAGTDIEIDGSYLSGTVAVKNYANAATPSNDVTSLTITSSNEITYYYSEDDEEGSTVFYTSTVDGSETGELSSFNIDTEESESLDLTITSVTTETTTIDNKGVTILTVDDDSDLGVIIVNSGTTTLNVSEGTAIESITITGGTLILASEAESVSSVPVSVNLSSGAYIQDYTASIATLCDEDGETTFEISHPDDEELTDDGSVSIGVISVNNGYTYTCTLQKLDGTEWEEVDSNNTTGEFVISETGTYRVVIVTTVATIKEVKRMRLRSAAPSSTDGNILYTQPFEITKKASTTPGTSEVTCYTVKLPSVTGATSSPEAGISFSFTIILDADYSESTPVVTVGSTTITPNSSGKYVITGIASDKTIVITGITLNTVTGTAAVESADLRVWTAGGQLHIYSPEASTAYVVAFGGRLYKTLALPVGETATPLPQGAYIIHIDGQSYKIRL